MKISKHLMIVMLFLVTFTVVSAQTDIDQELDSIWSYGLEGGIAVGDNAGAAEDMSPQIRGFLQLDMAKQLFTRFGISYLPIRAEGVYSTQIVMADARLLFRPVQMRYLSPYLYLGIGAAKDTQAGSSAVVASIPFGAGFQTRLSPALIFEISGGYTLALSDKLNGKENEGLNRISNKKQDGLFSLTASIVLSKAKETQSDLDLKAMDSDGDGLSDYAEKYIYHTDPLNPDTDGDGMNDGAEVKANRKPLDPKDDVMNSNR